MCSNYHLYSKFIFMCDILCYQIYFVDLLYNNKTTRVWFLREQKHTSDGLWPRKPPLPPRDRRLRFSHYHTADRHPRSCDISFGFRAFSHIFHKNTHPSMIKSVGDFISTQRNSLRTLRDFGRVCTYIFCKLLLSDGSMHVTLGYMIIILVN
jgi:hypothetical protein